MLEIYKEVVFKNYANFKGRARRKEFWMFTLINIIIYVFLDITDNVSGLTFGKEKTGILSLIYSLLVFLPGFAVSVRRLHDIGKSGWLFLILFSVLIGICGFIIFLPSEAYADEKFLFVILILLLVLIWPYVLFCKQGDKGSNKYGEDPKKTIDEIDEIGKE